MGLKPFFVFAEVNTNRLRRLAMKNYGYIEWTDTKETFVMSDGIVTFNSETRSDFFQLSPVIKVVPDVINWEAFKIYPEISSEYALTQ